MPLFESSYIRGTEMCLICKKKNGRAGETHRNSKLKVHLHVTGEKNANLYARLEKRCLFRDRHDIKVLRNGCTRTCCCVEVRSKPCCNLYACSVTTLWGDWFLSNSCSIWNKALNVTSNSNKTNQIKRIWNYIWIFQFPFHVVPQRCLRNKRLLCEWVESTITSLIFTKKRNQETKLLNLPAKKAEEILYWWNYYSKSQVDNLELAFLRCCSVCGLSDCAASCKGIGMDSSVWLLEETKVALNVRTTIKN